MRRGRKLPADGDASRPFGGSLFWKLLVPFFALLLVIGIAGAILIVRDLSRRAEQTLDQELTRRSLEARAILHDRELYLLESANLASNLEGMAERVQRRAASGVKELLGSVMLLKTDITLAIAADEAGSGLSELARRSTGVARETAGTAWSRFDFVSRALGEQEGTKSSGLLVADGGRQLAVAAPICSSVRPCAPVGVAIVALRVDSLANEIVARAGRAGVAGPASVSIYDASGALLASSGPAAAPGPARGVGEQPVRRIHSDESEERAVLYSSLDVQGRSIGTLAVSVRTRPVFAAVRGAGIRLAFVLAIAMVGVIGIGALVTRFILRQVRPLVETNRALGAGDLSARVPVVSRDELGELARGVNQMAEQLQANYETLELRVDQRTGEVRRLLQERSELFAGLSHELRTPVAVILTQAAMLKDKSYPQSNRWTREVGDTISQSGEQLLSLINEILEFAKAEAGRIEVKLAAVKLPEMLRGMRGTMEGLARASGLRFAVRVPRDLPAVSADPARLREILMNLVDNAVKYSAAGGKIEVTAAVHNGAVDLSVSDTGVGIPAEAGDSIFEPFYRVPGSETQAGQPASGLGLALSKRLVEAQGGTIRYESAAGTGSTFVVTLARAPGRSSKDAARTPRNA